MPFPTVKTCRFEYHTSLHHSQTSASEKRLAICLSTILLYIILKPIMLWIPSALVWVPYFFTSFSNYYLGTLRRFFVWVPYFFTSFSNLGMECTHSIRVWVPYFFTSFSNRSNRCGEENSVWVPYFFTSFSNIYPETWLTHGVWVPYFFTSFSNSPWCR